MPKCSYQKISPRFLFFLFKRNLIINIKANIRKLWIHIVYYYLIIICLSNSNNYIFLYCWRQYWVSSIVNMLTYYIYSSWSSSIILRFYSVNFIKFFWYILISWNLKFLNLLLRIIINILNFIKYFYKLTLLHNYKI